MKPTFCESSLLTFYASICFWYLPSIRMRVSETKRQRKSLPLIRSSHRCWAGHRGAASLLEEGSHASGVVRRTLPYSAVAHCTETWGEGDTHMPSQEGGHTRIHQNLGRGQGEGAVRHRNLGEGHTQRGVEERMRWEGEGEGRLSLKGQAPDQLVQVVALEQPAERLASFSLL